MVLVVGATGVLGHETALQLLAAGFPVRALVRTPTKAADLKEKGAEIVQGDLTVPASLARACQGADVVVAAAHGLLGRGKNKSEQVDDLGHRSLVDAALSAGVKHFIYTSAHGVSPDHAVDFYRTKYQTEQYLMHSGLRYTILRPSAFMEWHAHNLLGKNILEKGSVTIFGRGETPINFIAGRDVAQLIRQVIQTPSSGNRHITVGGPDNLSRNQVAELYGRLGGVTPKVRHIAPGTLQVLSKLISPFHPGIGRIMHMSAAMDSVDGSLDMTSASAEFPLPLTSIHEFVQEQVDRYKRHL